MPQKFFYYKGFPLVRNKNEIYYGFMCEGGLNEALDMARVWLEKSMIKE